jgi:hypothetical protein
MPPLTRDALRDVATPALDFVTSTESRCSRDALRRIFGLFDALAAVAVVIAALGIVNTRR